MRRHWSAFVAGWLAWLPLAASAAPAAPAVLKAPDRSVVAAAGAGAGPSLPAAAWRPVLRHYAVLVHATYADTLERTRRLQAAVRRLVTTPSEPALADARQAWLHARQTYALTEAFRFYGGPVDGDDGPEPRINSWPVDEAYIDGLIASPRQPLTRAALSDANQRAGEENVATGWHAIEYLLWGADTRADGPGDRPAADYQAGSPHAARRGRYLSTVTDLLVKDLDGLVRAWAPAAPNYRRRFEQAGLASVRDIVVGLGMLSRAELAGERMEVPLASQDQEDEQSCFSDNTHRDIQGNAMGIRHVWLGRYTADDGSLLQGPSLADLVAARQPELAQRLSAQIDASVAAAMRIQPPFDREIVGDRDAPGRHRVQQVIDSVVAQSAALLEAARVLGLPRLQGFRRP